MYRSRLPEVVNLQNQNGIKSVSPPLYVWIAPPLVTGRIPISEMATCSENRASGFIAWCSCSIRKGRFLNMWTWYTFSVHTHPLSQNTVTLARNRVPWLILNLILGSDFGSPQSISVNKTQHHQLTLIHPVNTNKNCFINEGSWHLPLQMRFGLLHSPLVHTVAPEPFSFSYPRLHSKMTLEPSGKLFNRSAELLKIIVSVAWGFWHWAIGGKRDRIQLHNQQ